MEKNDVKEMLAQIGCMSLSDLVKTQLEFRPAQRFPSKDNKKLWLEGVVTTYFTPNHFTELLESFMDNYNTRVPFDEKGNPTRVFSEYITSNLIGMKVTPIIVKPLNSTQYLFIKGTETPAEDDGLVKSVSDYQGKDHQFWCNQLFGSYRSSTLNKPVSRSVNKQD